MKNTFLPGVMLAFAAWAVHASPPPAKPAPSMQDILDAARPDEWRRLDPEHTLYMQLPQGRVVMELAPDFAPAHVANIETLVREHYFDHLSITRSQDNYVVQWGDAEAGSDQARPSGHAKKTLPDPEFDHAIDGKLDFTALPDRDTYAPQTGFVRGFPAARDARNKRMWLVHCYGMLGVGRDNDPASGSGMELYVVIGHAPRHLDRNVTLVGRVVDGMEYLSTLPRGHGELGFYQSPTQYVPIESIRLGSQLPKSARAHLQLLRTDSASFRKLIKARRFRRESWFVDPVGHLGVCNMPLPVRENPAPTSAESTPDS